MKTKTENLLSVMNVLSWITFIGLMVKAGVILVSFGISIVNPDRAKDLYQGLNLYNVRNFNFAIYLSTVSLMITILVLEAYTAYLVIKVLSKIKLSNPFTMEVSKMLERISYFIFSIWIVSMVYNAHIKWLMKRMDVLQEKFISGEFIFLAAVVFVFSQIFKKGVEIQSENELTI